MKMDKTKIKYLNLACGNNYIINDEWLNLDYIKKEGVQKIDLLRKLPIKSNSIEAVYCSHFIEHIPAERVIFFLNECKRVLKNNGTLRIVTLDFEKMVIEYLERRESDDSEKADYMMMSIIDQFVRTVPGGELSKKIEETANSADEDLKNYINKRSGNVIGQEIQQIAGENQQIISRLARKIEKLYISILLNFLPSSFRNQNVSMAEVGELHKWIYDKHNLSQILKKVGFKKINLVDYCISNIKHFPLSLDTDKQNKPKKGEDSIFIEAEK